MGDEVDAVVIGSGPNGLVAANLLADAGWDVLVLEAADVPGGAVRTAELVAPGFRADLFSAFYPLGAASPVIAGLGLERHGLVWRRAPEVLAHVLPDDRCVLLSTDPDRTAASVEAFGVGDGQAWHAEVALWQRARAALLESLLRPFPPVRAGARLVGALGTAEALRLVRSFTQSVRAYGADRFSGVGAPLLLAGNAMHTDLGPEQAGGAAFGWLLSMLGQDVGYPVPEGGAGALTDALVRRLGRRVECGREVTGVVVAGGRALGVRDASGGLVRARRAVLADVPAPTLYLRLVGADHLPARLVHDLARFAWDDATIKVDWALSRPIPWLAPQARLAGTVHLGGDLDGLSASANELERGLVPTTPFLIMGQMTTADPSRSPAGTESVWAYTHVPRGGRWPADRLRRHADVIEDLVERHAPGFRDAVLGRVVQGPGDLEDANPSLVGGSINQGTAAVHQQLVFRPVPGLGRADTPVDRLFLAGSSAHPGGGVHGAAGANAARAALARAGLAGDAYRLLVDLAHRAVY
ncbi:NAD(P)/FAD-dependent oxidoreductase [Saccharothrix violaceirubra]|uniref:Pyridine nucleotide-disulfide oxidoreductase domain-containing protein 2 n=1 Tax=Saccharothrix violaceirubra TaxID=413306 RepID=A0A7W7WX70_9PSEU|nr:NAD(P)/FAD-dependent oxidoreductase [Saccharothrix violaceirubra]MBB4967129.1 phytoene dehydrogenase-like protein [Saccharothrix violaceirubra]